MLWSLSGSIGIGKFLIRIVQILVGLPRNRSVEISLGLHDYE